jgi:hypothetical protein
MGAKQASALTQENSDNWNGIPGKFDILIHNDHYFFHCLNPDDVIYKGLRPEFEQYGPYVYKEYDTYSDVIYEQQLPVNGRSDSSYSDNIKNKDTATGLYVIFNQWMELYEDPAYPMD